MKQKWMIVLAMLGCVCALTACGDNESSTADPAPAAAQAVQNADSAAESEAETEEIVQQIVIDDEAAGAGEANAIGQEIEVP